MKYQVLSIEQMRHLQELGVDTSNASMNWETHPDESGRAPELTLRKWNTFKDPFRKEYCIPAFALQDIIELLPKVIEYNFEKYYFLMKYYEHEDMYAFLYSNGNNSIKYICEYEIMDSTYKMLCWVAENGYLKGGRYEND